MPQTCGQIFSHMCNLPECAAPISTNIYCECGAAVMYYSNMFVSRWIHLLSGKQLTVCIYTHCTHTSHTHLFSEVFIYLFFSFLPELIVSRIHMSLATLPLRRGWCSSGAGRHPSARQSYADTVNKTVFKSAAPTPRCLSRSPDRTVHLRTLGPIIQAFCRNTQCLQHPAQHPTWCH